MIDTSKAMRFMTNNFLETGYASLVATSNADGYDFADALNPRERTKVFKFGGRFLIDSTNNKMYIGGVTYTIPSFDYLTAQDLCSAINSVITGIASITYGSDNDFILIPEAAPRTFNLTTTTNAIWETIGFSTGANITAAGVGSENHANMVRLHWPYEEITIDFGYQAQIGFIGMISDLAEEFKIPAGAVIEIFGNTVNNFAAPPLSQQITRYETGAFKFLDDISDSAWRYIKLRITCPTGSFLPELGYLYIGDYSVFPERNISTEFEMTHDDGSILSRSDDGQIYSNDKTPLRVYSSLQVGLAKPECAAFLKNIYKLKQLSTPFFVHLDPKEYLSDSFEEHMALVRFSSPPKYKHIIRDLFEFSFELREAI
jgi:hypothetical protein